MSLWNEKKRIMLTCPKGVVGLLRTEVERLGYPVAGEIDTAVYLEATLADAMRLNLHLRTASRVLYQIATFKVISPAALYDRIYALPWEQWLYESGPQAYLCVTSVVENPLVNDSRFVNVKVKDAIVDRIRDQRGARPDSGSARDRAVIHVYWKNDQATVYIDTSGERLSMRGYRKIPLSAPLQEGLAAALILAAGWRGKGAFVNPMCGSGTLAIEAALLAQNRAPGLLRSRFGFMSIKDFPAESWQEMRKQARLQTRRAERLRIVAADIDPQAVEAARRNAQTAGVDSLIEFQVCAFEQTRIPPGGGVIMVNPPYGERLDVAAAPAAAVSRTRRDISGNRLVVRKAAEQPKPTAQGAARQKLEALYGGLGDFFKQTGRGYQGYIFTGNLEMIKKIGLKTKRRMTFFNGEIECRLLEYDLYSGSKKVGRLTNDDGASSSAQRP
ncbi:MAG TPA: class I SAM-dependent RNA methyltransferase [Smithellaceae bacterium]|nr:class I SAM-dependent RNA methyltransferase [Smithellaceae bacterium]